MFANGKHFQECEILYRLPVQMRIPFGQIHLFIDNLFCAQYISILNKKGWAESQVVERQREWEMECCYERDTAWAIKLTVGQIFITARERIILCLMKMNIKIICKNLHGYFSLGAMLFHLTVKLLMYTTPIWPIQKLPLKWSVVNMHPGADDKKLFCLYYTNFRTKLGICKSRLENLVRDKHSSLLQ